MDENSLLEKVTAQRDRLAHYIFREDGGALSGDYCRAEIAAGRCPYRDQPYGTEMKATVCVPCIVELIGNTPEPPQ